MYIVYMRLLEENNSFQFTATASKWALSTVVYPSVGLALVFSILCVCGKVAILDGSV